MVKWIDREESMPEASRRIIAFSPEFPIGDTMRYRLVSGDSFRVFRAATHWIDIEATLGAPTSPPRKKA